MAVEILTKMMAPIRIGICMIQAARVNNPMAKKKPPKIWAKVT